MAVGRTERRERWEPRFIELFGRDDAAFALDVFGLTELAWHDCYGESTPPDEIVTDMLTVSGGSVRGFTSAAALAVADWRDLKVAALKVRDQRL